MEISRKMLKRWRISFRAIAQELEDLAQEIEDAVSGAAQPRSRRNYYAQANRRMRETGGTYYYPAKPKT